MVEEPKRTLAYLCPECRQPVLAEKTVFSLAAGPSSVPCPCGKSALKIDMLGDHVNLTVPCLLCEKEHSVSCSTHAFLHEKALAFACAASGLDCCYVGEEGAVFAAMRRLEETVDKLQALKVYTQYRDLISTAPLEIIYSGSADLERVKQALAAAFATLPREEVRVISTAAPHVCRESVQHVEDVLDVTQGKLGMGFSCGSDDMPALLMGNTLFGGSSNSKLFLNVREKLSLCYYASSLYHRQKGLITVSSGIEFQNYQRAYDEIMAQLEAVQKGELEDWELEGARSTLLNNYATVGDSQGKLENFYLGQAATGQHETPADLARAIQDMTAERICRAMSTVKLDTVYFLKGKEGEA